MPAQSTLAAVGGSVAAVGDDAADRDLATVALRLELGALKVRELRKRASSAGVDGNAVEEALDSVDAKAALLELLVQRRREVGALADVLPALEAGGEEAVVVVGGCLEHAMEVLDTLSASGGRRERKVVMELLDRLEVAAESVDLVWCVGLIECSSGEIERLGSSVVGVRKLNPDEGADSGAVAMAAVLELLESVNRCGSIVLRASSVLSAAVGEQSEEAVGVSLEALRWLSGERQEEVSSEEVSAAIVILPHMVEGQPLGVRVSANMALFTLGCRNGLAVCTVEGVWDAMQV